MAPDEENKVDDHAAEEQKDTVKPVAEDPPEFDNPENDDKSDRPPTEHESKEEHEQQPDQEQNDEPEHHDQGNENMEDQEQKDEQEHHDQGHEDIDAHIKDERVHHDQGHEDIDAHTKDERVHHDQGHEDIDAHSKDERVHHDQVHEKMEDNHSPKEDPESNGHRSARSRRSKRERVSDLSSRTDKDLDEVDLDLSIIVKEPEILDPQIARDMEYIKTATPQSRLEIALSEALKRKDSHIERLSGEVHKLKAFISKRKQTYKRKRKDEGAPTRALSAYNIFVQDRFAQLAKENEAALKSADSDAQLKRVPPANLVASTGNQWKELDPEQKQKYEERAKQDRKRYEEQMAQYQPPDKQANRKRNKTGYNMFFSAHVLRLKQSECGVPSERGSVARLVGTAWKQLSAEEKQYYEREADKHNGMNPVEKDGEEEEDEDMKRQHQVPDPYAHMHGGHDMHMHGTMPPPMHPSMHQPPQHDPRHHGYAPYPSHHMYGQPPHGYYDYSQHHSQSRHQHRSQGYSQGYPPQQRHPYDNGGLQM